MKSNRHFHTMALVFVAVLCCCRHSGPSSPGTFPSKGGWQIIFSHAAAEGSRTPVIVRARTPGGILDRAATGSVSVRMDDRESAAGYVKRGVGSALVTVADQGEIGLYDDRGLRLGGAERKRRLFDTVVLTQAVADTITVINGGTAVMVPGSVTLPAGKTLTIHEGAAFFVGEKVTVFCNGPLLCEGSSMAPVLFAAIDEGKPWGGIVIAAPSVLCYAIFTQGGGDESRVRGHSNSQAVIDVVNSSAEISNCFFVYNAGKGVTSSGADVTMDSCLFSFCDMGGEFDRSRITVRASHILFIPDMDTAFVDDDNDGFYFHKPPGDASDSTYSLVEWCVIYRTKDDGIDHNGALLRVRNCWIESVTHEGLAASNTNRAVLYNCYITGCDQGVEAGYGKPRLEVDHCLITGNKTGVRLGDSYALGDLGSVQVTNSVVSGNEIDFRNFDRKIQGPRDSAIVVNYSLVDTAQVAAGAHNLHGKPELGADMILRPGSPGTKAGSDGKDMGLVSGL